MTPTVSRWVSLPVRRWNSGLKWLGLRDLPEFCRGALDGLLSYENADPEPGPNRGRAFWWGWWCGKSPRPESDDPRDVEVYWVMRALAKEMRKAP